MIRGSGLQNSDADQASALRLTKLLCGFTEGLQAFHPVAGFGSQLKLRTAGMPARTSSGRVLMQDEPAERSNSDGNKDNNDGLRDSQGNELRKTAKGELRNRGPLRRPAPYNSTFPLSVEQFGYTDAQRLEAEMFEDPALKEARKKKEEEDDDLNIYNPAKKLGKRDNPYGLFRDPEADTTAVPTGEAWTKFCKGLVFGKQEEEVVFDPDVEDRLVTPDFGLPKPKTKDLSFDQRVEAWAKVYDYIPTPLTNPLKDKKQWDIDLDGGFGDALSTENAKLRDYRPERWERAWELFLSLELRGYNATYRTVIEEMKIPAKLWEEVKVDIYAYQIAAWLLIATNLVFNILWVSRVGMVGIKDAAMGSLIMYGVDSRYFTGL